MKIRVQWYVGSEVDWLRVYQMHWKSSWKSGKHTGRKLLMEQTFDKEGYEQGDCRITNHYTDALAKKLHPQIERLVEMVSDREDYPLVNVIDAEFK